MGKLKEALNLPRIYWILIVAAVFLAILGGFFIFQASRFSEYEQRRDYSWSINSLSEEGAPIDLDTVQITYHFSEEEGSLSFHPRYHIDKLIVIFPESLKENVALRINRNNSWESLQVTMPAHKQNEGKATILFSGNNTGEWIIMDFKMDLSPNADFDVSKNSHWYGGQIYFDFGKDFECIREDCAFNILNLRMMRANIPFVNSLRLEMINQTMPGEPLHKFETSARSLKVLNTKSFRTSIGASLIAGAIFAIFSIIIGIIQHPKKKNGRKKRTKS